MISETPMPPYYAVIFTSVRTNFDKDYNEISEKMIKLTNEQEGFWGIESAREKIGITLSYWKDLDSIEQWRNNIDHCIAQERGRKEWYLRFKVRITKVERDYQFNK